MSAPDSPRREACTLAVQLAGVEAVSALFDAPGAGADADAARPVLLAHGAGANMESAFITAIASGLAERGFPVFRFDYPYMERARREGRRFPPNRKDVLLATHRLALAELERRCPGRPPLLVGKSMGARMGSYLAAEGERCAGLIHLGYPLHPARKPERLRSEHFPLIVAPTLFLQGTRDALCDLDLLRAALPTHGSEPTLALIEGADHGFSVLKRSGRTDAEVLAELLEHMVGWSALHPL